MSAVSVSESGVRPILAGAVDLARRALLELQPTGVGEHLGVTGENECAATHHFAATLPGYRGWRWEVVVAAAPDAEYATVSESALLPGPDALVAPEFVPWDQRIRPGDLAPGDLLAPRVDDPRLVPGYLETGDPVVDEVCEEVGLGRRQVLSREGRVEAAERWYSEFGPDTEMARSAPGTCGVCGFFVPLAGALRAAFGVCANAMGADGRVVHVEYGCGAHSDTELPTGAGSPLYEAYDDAAIEVVPAEELNARDGSAEAAAPSTIAPEASTGAEASTDLAATEPDTAAAEDTAAESVSDGVEGGEASEAGSNQSSDVADSAGDSEHVSAAVPEAVAAEGISDTVESQSDAANDVSATGGSGAATEVPTADAAAHRTPAADAAPETAAVEEPSTAAVAEPAESGALPGADTAEGAPADPAGNASADMAVAPSAETAEDAPAETATKHAAADAATAHVTAEPVREPAESAPAANATAGREQAEADPAVAEADSNAWGGAAEVGTAAESIDTAPAGNTDAGSAGSSAALAAGQSGEVDGEAESPSATGDSEAAATTGEVGAAADRPAAEAVESAGTETGGSAAAGDDGTGHAGAEADAGTADNAGEAAPLGDSGDATSGVTRYSDAWAVSAVRVQPGETGAAEEN
ncbi:DUF3027 domain-containing protein [Nocardia nova]|uniref:DUF3027 domain-containing protein n=1 Tax=Nocardia nova TaxID=37330 RepID=UPI002B4B33C4|nr:DUF3027 domain-containing protein [Nocardia nova]